MQRLALLCTPALALALTLPGAARSAPESSGKPAQPYMDLQPVGLPAIVHGRLVNYIFVDVRLMLAKGADAAKLQEQEPFIRDTLVRTASRAPFNPPEDGVHLDEPRLKAEILRETAAQMGAGKVINVEIRSQTPQRRTGVPGGAQP